jgi:hypothetical protein
MNDRKRPFANSRANAVRAGVLAASALFGAGFFSPADAQIKSGSVEAIIAQEKQDSYARASVSFNAPLDINGYSYIELYRDGTYYGKTSLARDITRRLTAEAMVTHSGTPIRKVGLGVGLKLPMPRDWYAKVRLMPAWFKGKGAVLDEVMAVYSVGYSHGRFNFSSFGYENLSKKAWSYGEIDLKINIIEGMAVGYNPKLEATSSGKPHLVHRIKVEIGS